MITVEEAVEAIVSFVRELHKEMVNRGMIKPRARPPRPRRIVVEFKNLRWNRYQAQRINEFIHWRQHRGNGYRGRSARNFRIN